MNAEIIFDTSGEEFKDNGVSEVIKVLREVQESLLRGDSSGRVLGDDGKVIGRWDVQTPAY